VSQPSKPVRFLQNSLLVLCSIAFIELAMRLSGAVYNKIQRSQNKPLTGTPVILCLGESTTAWGLQNSYPARLQSKLDQIYGPKSYVVINEGVAATNTDVIREKLNEKIETYKPKIVITLMGINDVWAISDNTSPLDDFKLYKLYKLVRLSYENSNDSVKSTSQTVTQPPPEVPTAAAFSPFYQAGVGEFVKAFYEKKDLALADQKLKYLQSFKKEFASDEMAQYFAGDLALLKGNLKESDLYMEKSIKLDPRLKNAMRIASLYFYKNSGTDVKTNLLARKYLELALKAEPDSIDALALMGVSYTKPPLDDDKALAHLNKAWDLGGRHFDIITHSAGIFINRGLFKEAEERLISGLYEEGDVIWVWKELIDFYIKQKRFEDAEKYLKKAETRFPGNVFMDDFRTEVARLQNKQVPSKIYTVMNFYDFPPTRRNYKAIVNDLLLKNITPVIMQYPRRSIEPLKEILKSYDEVVYVSNEANFTEALKKYDYNTLFIDNFGNDFGHFTLTSSDMIADNIIVTLQKENILPQP
jgi:tetratricopeptide (TPR) repeat protein